MKLLKAGMLGSVAALSAVSSGQAAELPVKAKPVEYVKICSLYGAGFYYMPGTDMCLKIGGWVRAEAGWGVDGNLDLGPFDPDVNNRLTNNLVTRERGYITADAREQTAYGIARGYIAVGISSNDIGSEAPSAQFSANRAFVEWAGFTVGLSESFYDFYSVPAVSYRNFMPASDTGDTGWWVWAYTAQFGGGFSATISAEERRITQNLAFNGPGGTLGGPITNGALPGGTFVTGGGYGGWQTPDVVANLRIDQTWGGAQIMGALHEVNAGYYSAMLAWGHPDNAWGFAVGGGVKINLPVWSQGDYFQSQLNFAEGASRYLSFFNEGDWAKVSGATEGYGVMSDCIYGGGMVPGATNATSCQLTTGWGINASYEHYWTPEWHQSLYGSYTDFRYDSSANGMLCVGEGFGTGAGSTATAAAGCNNNWSTWDVGSRLQWNVTRSFYVGADVSYQQLISAATPGGVLPAAATLAGSGATTVANQPNWTYTLRAHKDFLP
jgi:Porin subfamily